MDPATIVAVAAVVIGNAVGWFVAYGRLAQKVERNSDLLVNGLSDKVQAISESVTKNEGLTEKVDNLSNSFSELKGTVITFMKMSRDQTKD